ncbi:MAG: hypothetical protein AAF790_13205 [Planctomycetota bacterium]
MLMLLGLAVLSATGVWMIADGDWLGFLVAGFALFAVPVFAIQLLPGAAYLRVDQNGVRFAVAFRETAVPWESIAESGVYEVKGSRLVGFNYTAKAGRVRQASRSLTGYEGGLPDTYGMKAEELASLLDHRLHLHRSGGSEAPAPS